jgi:ADP-heptose:LPS heptosyltransferase
MPAMPPRNVLIFHNGALGDFVLNWPLALTAGRLYPQSRIFYVTPSGKGQLARAALKVESIDAEGGWHHLYADPDQLPQPAARRLAGAHCIFSFVNRPGDQWEQNVRRCAPHAQVYCLQPTPPPDYPRHATQFLLEQLTGSPAIFAAVEQILRSIADRGIGAATDGTGEAVLLHPGSGSPKKCWPVERFARLASLLIAGGRRVCLLLGEVERERFGPADLDRFPSAVERLILQTPLQLFEQLSSAGLFVGNDSGPGHLAGIIGLPVVSLFGPTSPDVWHPLGPRVRVMRRNNLDELTVDDVSRALQFDHE